MEIGVAIFQACVVFRFQVRLVLWCSFTATVDDDVQEKEKRNSSDWLLGFDVLLCVFFTLQKNTKSFSLQCDWVS
jgi:hypothetical protein